MPNARRWQQSGARRGWSIHEELQQQAWLRPAPPQQSHRPQESERPRQKVQSVPDRVPQNPDEIVTEARSRVAKLEAAIVAVGEGDPVVPSLKESLRQARLQAKVLSRGGSHRRDKTLHQEVKETRWCIARGSQSGPSCSCKRPRPSWFRRKMPFMQWESCGCRLWSRIAHGTPETIPDSSSGFCTRTGTIESSVCWNSHGRGTISDQNCRQHGSEERQRKTRVVDPLQEVALGDTLVGATDWSNRGRSIKFDGDVD